MTFLLDTDHVSLDQRGHPIVRARVQAAGSTQVAVSIITVEEQMRGWLAAIRAATTPEARTTAYQRLRMAVEYFASFAVVDYTVQAEALVSDLRKQGIRIGTQDLRIAAIAIVHGITLVTRNTRDFAQVPGLVIEDWSAM
ncbi:type II toxin-antitoxin system VapC family toxin [Candidatus Chloroploca sp. Khr17]|uniref:type II toxin-antitoxin system VapC family toxin n=1 Tax=Candidatus Chloroploca sp. Khr17 TaxID=2496869 RepID=UPI00101D2BDF|nr:type II toxin-antitoxin system VapC family toxin [Candidatus Chloroploca sp. Khr17]